MEHLLLSDTHYRREIKLVAINMDYFLLHFDPLKFVLRIRQCGVSVPEFHFFNIKPYVWTQNRKVHRSSCHDTNFHNISDISLRYIMRRNYN